MAECPFPLGTREPARRLEVTADYCDWAGAGRVRQGAEAQPVMGLGSDLLPCPPRCLLLARSAQESAAGLASSSRKEGRAA